MDRLNLVIFWTCYIAYLFWGNVSTNDSVQEWNNNIQALKACIQEYSHPCWIPIKWRNIMHFKWVEWCGENFSPFWNFAKCFSNDLKFSYNAFASAWLIVSVVHNLCIAPVEVCEAQLENGDFISKLSFQKSETFDIYRTVIATNTSWNNMRLNF